MTLYGRSLRRKTNLTVLSDDELTARAVRFLTYLLLNKSSVNPSGTVLMDETAVFFEDPQRDTVDFTGARHVCLALDRVCFDVISMLRLLSQPRGYSCHLF